MEETPVTAYILTDLTAEFIPDGWGEEIVDLDGRDLTAYEPSIRKYIQKENEMLSDGGNLAAYMDQSHLREKIRRIEPTVLFHEGKLYGCAAVELKEELAEREWNALFSYLSGQYSDGWGEGFEQRDIPVDGGVLNVHFWQPGQRFPLVLDSAEPVPPQKPKMQLLGQDGNIFSILGRATRLLHQNGQDKQADEMFRRVQTCGDYHKALCIISEYVQTELSPAAGHSEKNRQKRGEER